MEKDDEIIENIKKRCSCKHCHGSMKNMRAECSCTRKCNSLTRLQLIRTFHQINQTGAEWLEWRRSVPYDPIPAYPTNLNFGMWVVCAELAKKIGLSNETVLAYQKRGVEEYDQICDFPNAKKYSENFGLTELTEYYQKIIDLRASRPE